MTDERTVIQLFRSDVAGRKPSIEQLDLGELAVNYFDAKLFIKRQQEQFEEIVEFVGNVPIKNTLYVQKNGRDTNSGESWNDAVLTIEKALELAWDRNELTLIDIGPGVYETEGHLDMPDNCVIRSPHRATFIRPKSGFEERNVFRMGSGCFIEGPVFENWRLDSLENPTEGFAVCFRPGAIITRVPYAHKIAIRTNPTWTGIAPPLDRNNANPLVGRGAGVALADASVLSPYSIFPNIMTWGATPVSHNGIGYCAKNGGLINAVNAVSLWAHKHFLAIDGGQIILSSCSTQFGDFTMVSQGVRKIINPVSVSELEYPITFDSSASLEVDDYNSIVSIKGAIIDDMWDELVQEGFVGTTGQVLVPEDEFFTRKDAELFIQSFAWVVKTQNEKPAEDFAKSFFDVKGDYVFDVEKLPAFIFSYEYMRDRIVQIPSLKQTSIEIIESLTEALIQTLNNPRKINEPSLITAIGHTWTGVMAGVALTKIPPARNQTTIQESILELDQDVVIASGQDDQGSAIFVGGMEINADTGELSGPPFISAVNRIANKAVIARSF
jgi:hypothetical protein